MREIMVERPWLKVGCTLGEGSNLLAGIVFNPLRRLISTGPLYDPGTGILHFVDIAEKRVCTYSCGIGK